MNVIEFFAHQTPYFYQFFIAHFRVCQGQRLAVPSMGLDIADFWIILQGF